MTKIVVNAEIITVAYDNYIDKQYIEVHLVGSTAVRIYEHYHIFAYSKLYNIFMCNKFSNRVDMYMEASPHLLRHLNADIPISAPPSLPFSTNVQYVYKVLGIT